MRLAYVAGSHRVEEIKTAGRQGRTKEMETKETRWISRDGDYIQYSQTEAARRRAHHSCRTLLGT
jgi:hypothetical protein